MLAFLGKYDTCFVTVTGSVIPMEVIMRERYRRRGARRPSVLLVPLGLAVSFTAGPVAGAGPGDYGEQTINGRAVKAFVTSECGGCHNPKRTGATGPDITKQRLHEGKKGLPPLNPKVLFVTIKHGRPGTSMPAWGTAENPLGHALKDAKIRAISGYLYNNAAPDQFQWSLEEMRDSHEVLVTESSLPAKPTHDHPVDDLLLVTERESFSVAVIDGDSLEVAAHLEAGARAHGYTFGPEGRYAYNLGRDGWLYKYDLYSMQAVRKVRLGLDARGIAISDDGRYLLAGMYVPTQAAIVDARTLEPLKLIDTHDVKAIGGGRVDSRICSVNDVDPDKVGPYFLMALKEAGQVWRIDYSDPDFPVEKVGNVGEILHDGFLRPDNQVYFLASQNSDHVAAIDVARMKVVKKIKTGKKPHPGEGAVWEADGRLYAAAPHIGDNKNVVWDAETFEIVGEVPSNSPGLFVRTAENMEYVWFDSVFPPETQEIVVHEKEAPFKVVKRINDGTQTLHPEPDADGDYILVSDWKEGVVRVYDDESLALVKTIKGITTPTGIFSVARREESTGH